MKLPVVLAGPFLRRTESDQVNIWIACSEEFEISAELFLINADNREYSYKPVYIHTFVKSVPLGDKLIANLIKLTPGSGTFPLDRLLGYNLRFTKTRVSFDMGSLGLLTPGAKDSLVYGHLKYPSFYITERKDCRLLYGSCRKLHGKGDDALAGADLLLQDHCLNLEERPEALFLMGDQIYADDVAGPVMPFITKFGETLTGRKENLVKIEPRLGRDPYKTALDGIYGRQRIASDLCKFSSRNSSNHLLRFGEYASMYLLAFNPDIWRLAEREGFLASFEEWMKRNPVLSSGKNTHTIKRAYDKQLKELRKFAASLPHVRRVMANIPSYMIFDDHDITDDWNITSQWRQDVWHSPLGRHVISNGLTAYWAFQGWGNHPDSFDDTFTDMISSHLSSKNEKKESRLNWETSMWSFDRWTYTAPTYPPAVFLDTRTQRSFPGKDRTMNLEGPQLINELGWLQAKYALLECGWNAGDPLIVVSSVPFYGIGLFDSAMKKAAFPLMLARIPVQTTFDMDSWKYNGKGYESFHKWIIDIDPAYCLILSGDAHYAYMATSVALYLDGDKKTLYQLTSSPLKNITLTGITSELVKAALQINLNKNGARRFIRDKTKTYHVELDHDFSHETVAKELIDYHTLEDGSIMETENNLGFIMISPDKMEASIVKFNRKTIDSRKFTK
ncbi:metallophosphoesterase family protein [Peribacillus glennii]|uniref:PhoD-like phosphatase metallophosphatase domain-containing protein n=1 Tax=Peribacillus glennii TaxID=2303991 RepID=A0A372LG70_9BACI|nr:hypothetical protein [Peribacillus glennii]RFU65298.1 hypothetical protein D0466_05200 [Peribacillus glennii]